MDGLSVKGPCFKLGKLHCNGIERVHCSKNRAEGIENKNNVQKAQYSSLEIS